MPKDRQAGDDYWDTYSKMSNMSFMMKKTSGMSVSVALTPKDQQPGWLQRM